ncbi:MAG TPA: hypothetical protein PKV41_04455, partial [Candidatus Omnitrophota bacterium]|nr:hypothetical protein [Candidatus Omnitrophota bacterium]
MKILIVHASAGAGHFKAAEAIYKGIKQSASHDVVLVDALDHASFLFKKFYKQSYFFLIAKIPSVWGFFFWILDLAWLQPLVRASRRIQNALNMGKLHQLMTEGCFDYIVMTHFMPTEIAAALKRSGRISSKLITVVTDFDVHRIWLADGIDTYTVASAWTKEKLKKIGVPESDIFVSGIPTDKKFSGPFDLAALRGSFG